MEHQTILPDINLLTVRDGSNQEWFADAWQRKAGCGPVCCGKYPLSWRWFCLFPAASEIRYEE